VDIRANDVPAGISTEDHAAGLESSLANLATYLKRWPRVGASEVRRLAALAVGLVRLEAIGAPAAGQKWPKLIVVATSLRSLFSW
jgi:hypothetical protein